MADLTEKEETPVEVVKTDGAEESPKIRTIVLAGKIDCNYNYENIIKSIVEWNAEDAGNNVPIEERTPIWLYITSTGGNAHGGWGLTDLISASQTPIYTCCLGTCMSAAFKIFLAGHKRYAGKHSVFMFHDTTRRDFSGETKDFENMTEKLKNLQEYSVQYVSERTNISKEKLQDILDRKQDWYIFADELLELGLIDDFLT